MSQVILVQCQDLYQVIVTTIYIIRIYPTNVSTFFCFQGTSFHSLCCFLLFSILLNCLPFLLWCFNAPVFVVLWSNTTYILCLKKSQVQRSINFNLHNCIYRLYILCNQSPVQLITPHKHKNVCHPQLIFQTEMLDHQLDLFYAMPFYMTYENLLTWLLQNE